MTDHTIVRLCFQEFRLAWVGACDRFVSQIENQYRDVNNLPEHGKRHARESTIEGGVVGCLTEIAVAKHLGRYWEGAGGYGTGDVVGVECRGTLLKKGRLRLGKKDNPDLPFVLGIVNPKDMREVWLPGWIYAWEGQKEEYWGDPSNRNRPAYWIGREKLRPMDTLLDVL